MCFDDMKLSFSGDFIEKKIMLMSVKQIWSSRKSEAGSRSAVPATLLGIFLKNKKLF